MLKDLHSRLPYWVRRRVSFQQRTATCLMIAAVVAAVFVMVQLAIFMYVKQYEQYQADLMGKVQKMMVNLKASSGQTPVQSQEGRRFSGAAMPGVPLDQRMLYTADKDQAFHCFQSGRQIPFDQVNDDYCDCPEDGSDEPSTNACALGSFACSQDDRRIPQSRVNDGICDCCDGSDEYRAKIWPDPLPDKVQLKLGRFQSPCSNHC
ncbi:uncharacterized protein LOC131877897 [Tigriopus californicus]|uniref:uncharacterized protein LOC131877897 n=1 Tax=Tigriopus californicus TaxID=6832 RepID=UPI0027DA63F8|nr:uncharacterized protein LOC131877897 [Tigriopus californicus]